MCIRDRKIIAHWEEASALISGWWWPICDIELNCGLFHIDVMGLKELHHIDDISKINVNGTEYDYNDIII